MLNTIRKLQGALVLGTSISLFAFSAIALDQPIAVATPADTAPNPISIQEATAQNSTLDNLINSTTNSYNATLSGDSQSNLVDASAAAQDTAEGDAGGSALALFKPRVRECYQIVDDAPNNDIPSYRYQSIGRLTKRDCWRKGGDKWN